jgi:hypothetical protein
VVRTRLMAHGAKNVEVHKIKQWSAARPSSYSILRKLAVQEGIRSLWRGMVPLLWRDVPFSALYWSAAETTRTFLLVLRRIAHGALAMIRSSWSASGLS